MYSLSGNITKNYEDFIEESEYGLYKVPRAGMGLIVGAKCNDGRPITESWRYKRALEVGARIICTEGVVPPKKKGGVNGGLKPLNVAVEPLVDRYAPKSIADVIGHKEQIKSIQQWLTEWDQRGFKGVANRGILVSGPPGIGKTTTVHLLAKEFGYSVTEYNASDTRSASVLKGMIMLGIKRLRKELIVMDEVDGMSDRGGVGELAAIIRKTNVPIICICNERLPKLKPLLGAGVCLDVRFSRPTKTTIAGALFKIAQKEQIQISKPDLETLCEQNGNDIRCILNGMEFYGGEDGVEMGNKDALLRMDAFSATQRLMGNKYMSLVEAENMVYVDYSMVPLMVSECYVAASKGSLEDVVRASEFVGFGDILDRKIHRGHEWNILPHYVSSIVACARSVAGPAPFQIFPQWLGKNSKRLKQMRWMTDISDRMRMNGGGVDLRLDYMDPLQSILLNPLKADKPDYKGLIQKMDGLRLTRDDLMDAFADVTLWDPAFGEKVEIATKVKTAFTREYNKAHSSGAVKKKGAKKAKTVGLVDDDDDKDDETSDADSGADSDMEMDAIEDNLIGFE